MMHSIARSPQIIHHASLMTNAMEALRTSLPVLRANLRCMVELGCLGDAAGVSRNAPPLPHSMANSIRGDAEACLAAIHKTRRALRDAGETPEQDGQPEWLDRVIDGEIPL